MSPSTENQPPSASGKPRLRGKIHLWATVLALGAGVELVVRSSSEAATRACLVYSGSLVSLFLISAIYHVPTWNPGARLWLRRLDHSAIFLLIAGTATPIFAVGLGQPTRTEALTFIWIGALVGILQSIFWAKAPKTLVAIFCCGLGWLGARYFIPLGPMVGSSGIAFLFGGGAAYSLGALVYALQRPNFKPGIFGYHELFHALVVVAAACHYALIFSIVTGAR